MPTPQCLPSPGHGEVEGILTRTAKNLPERPSRLMRDLAAMPVRREPVLRKTDYPINWAHYYNREAVLAQAVGTVNPIPCESCKRTAGPFTECVSVTGFFSGSCSNCRYNRMDTRCSFRSK